MTSYPARWLFDLIHELFHCGQDPELEQFAWIEDSELSEDRRMSREEQHAMWFSGQVGLDGRAEELAALAMKRANNGYLPKLKQSVVEGGSARGRQPQLSSELPRLPAFAAGRELVGNGGQLAGKRTAIPTLSPGTPSSNGSISARSMSTAWSFSAWR